MLVVKLTGNSRILKMKQSELTDLISTVFPGEPYPDESPIVQGYEDAEGTEEYEVAQAFRGKSWTEIDRETVRYHASSIPLFTVQARRYFLPAYMKQCVINYGYVDYAVTTLMHGLRLPEEDKTKGLTRSKFLEIADGFTDAQKSAIAHFLEYISEKHEQDFPVHKPSTTLDLYWKQFKK
jgi:hypothetical protein